MPHPDIRQKVFCFLSSAYVPADFDTKEKALSGSKAAISHPDDGRGMAAYSIYLAQVSFFQYFFMLLCRLQNTFYLSSVADLCRFILRIMGNITSGTDNIPRGPVFYPFLRILINMICGIKRQHFRRYLSHYADLIPEKLISLSAHFSPKVLSCSTSSMEG